MLFLTILMQWSATTPSFGHREQREQKTYTFNGEISAKTLVENQQRITTTTNKKERKKLEQQQHHRLEIWL